MFKYIILTEKLITEHVKGVKILSGEHKGKFAISDNALKEFKGIFDGLDYQIIELPSSAFVMDYFHLPKIGDYTLKGVLDNYDGTIDIILMRDGIESKIKRTYEGTWEDEDVEAFILGM
jgi:hypothetical protein